LKDCSVKLLSNLLYPTYTVFKLVLDLEQQYKLHCRILQILSSTVWKCKQNSNGPQQIQTLQNTEAKKHKTRGIQNIEKNCGKTTNASWMLHYKLNYSRSAVIGLKLVNWWRRCSTPNLMSHMVDQKGWGLSHSFGFQPAAWHCWCGGKKGIRPAAIIRSLTRTAATWGNSGEGNSWEGAGDWWNRELRVCRCMTWASTRRTGCSPFDLCYFASSFNHGMFFTSTTVLNSAQNVKSKTE